MRTLIFLLLLWPTILFANAATIVATRGEVFVENTQAVTGTEVEVGNHIITSAQSFCVLQFTDGSTITVRPSSEMILQKYEYPGAQSGVQVDLVSGGLRIITGAIAKSDPDQYRVKTPTALMGVRGTEFSIQYIENVE